jgi:sugar lactone lactonase YvrE
MTMMPNLRLARLERHVEGLGFPEGPVALQDGRLAFVDLLHHNVRLHDGRDTVVLADVPGSPNGMRLGSDGALYIANNGGIAPLSLQTLWHADPEINGRIQRLTLDGALTDYAVDLPGPAPRRPNDLAFDPDGRLLFTDPTNWEVLPDEDAYQVGHLCRVETNGAVTVLAEVPGFPNGLALGPDGALYVGQSIYHRVLRFDWHGDQLGDPSVWCQLPGTVGPDGIAWHEGRLIVAGSVGDEIDLVGLDGSVLSRLGMGEGSDPTNLCVHERALWVTLGLPGQLVSMDLEQFEP